MKNPENYKSNQSYIQMGFSSNSNNQQQFTISSRERIKLLVDDNSFQEADKYLYSCNPLKFPNYEEKLEKAAKQTKLEEAIVTGNANIGGIRVELGVMEPRFMMGSMGSVVGEKVCRAIERAIVAKCPLIICACSGGVRLQEGLLSLMQMAKTSTVLTRFHKNRLPFITIMAHPTTGGVLASFASLSDIIIAEPGALIGFMGSRVIKNAVGQPFNEDFNRSEFVFQQGMIDMIVDNSHMRQTLIILLKIHMGGEYN